MKKVGNIEILLSLNGEVFEDGNGFVKIEAREGRC
jgi:hypothetical protein